MMEKITPIPTPTSQPYFDGCRTGELRIQFCEHCESYQFYPRVLCAGCGSESLEWRTASGRGTIASFTIVRRAVSKAYEVPYVVALIDLVEGVRLMSHIVDVDVEHVRVGQSVTVHFEPWGGDVTLPVFRLLDQ